jgi:hypothetical protein
MDALEKAGKGDLEVLLLRLILLRLACKRFEARRRDNGKQYHHNSNDLKRLGRETGTLHAGFGTEDFWCSFLLVFRSDQ